MHITHPSCAVRVVSFFFSPVVRKIRDFRPDRVGLSVARIYNLTKKLGFGSARARLFYVVLLLLLCVAPRVVINTRKQ